MLNIRYNVLFIGALFRNTNEVWGGTVATSYAYKKAFENNEKYNIIFIPRTEIKTGDDYQKVISQYLHDILHVDDTRILNLIYNAGFSTPDVIGPITRSPIKTYGGDWKTDYTEEYFYNSKIIRLNRSEEHLSGGKIDYTNKITYINHGIDIDVLIPSIKEKKIVLWAGDKERKAKGYGMWEEIQDKIKLPDGYEYMTLSKYTIDEYWKLLDNVKIIVNTSLNESFCCAMFEAKSKAIPSIYKKNLHNGRHLDGRIQVEYDANAYGQEILKLLTNEEYYKQEAEQSRKYTVDNFSLRRMAETYSEVYDLVLKEKNKW